MTENKRFTKVEHIFELNDEGIKDNQTRIEYYYALDLIDLLNELSEENEQINRENSYNKLRLKSYKKALNELAEENKQLKKTLKQSYLNEICENCKYGHYFRSYNYSGLEGDFECEKGHDGADCDGLKECDDFELRY